MTPRPLRRALLLGGLLAATPVAAEIEGPPPGTPIRLAPMRLGAPPAKRGAERWGPVEVVTPRDAALERVRVQGNEIEHPDRIHFAHDAVRFVEGADDVLRRVAELLQSTPEIRLVLIEGHTDRSGSHRYNQRLSEARASAVRAALVRHGVAPERLRAYGFGETRPLSAPDGSRRRAQADRRVVFRLIEADRPALQRRRATEWGQAAVVGLHGEARWASVPAEGAPAAAGDDATGPGGDRADGLDWQPLRFRDALGEGVEVETGAEARVLLRLPDLTRIQLGPSTRLRLSKVFYAADEAKSYTAARVVHGGVRVMANPRELPRGRALFAFEGGSVDVGAADFDLTVDAEGRAELHVERGHLTVATGGEASIEVAAGQRLGLPAQGGPPRVEAMWPAPRSTGTGAGPFARAPTLTWQPVDGVDAYLVEFAEDPDFHQVAGNGRHVVADTRLTPDDLPPGRRYFWRVRALTPDGRIGRASAIHAFRLERGPASEGTPSLPAGVQPPASSAASAASRAATASSHSE